MLQLIRTSAKSFSKEEKGATLVEYAMLVTFIGAVAVGGVITFGTNLNTWIGNLATAIGKLY